LNLEICREIFDARDRGVVHCHLIETELLTLKELVQPFDLLFSSQTYREIESKQAKKVIELVLQYDLAYGEELMSSTEVEAFTSWFLSYFADQEAKYYTNGGWYEEPPKRSWTPATTATFDAEILVVGRSRAACLWLENEE
jgi:hypothetical protein